MRGGCLLEHPQPLTIATTIHSACRSIYGGFVKWIKGKKADGTDSIAAQVCSVVLHAAIQDSPPPQSTNASPVVVAAAAAQPPNARQVAPETHWPELQILVCVVSAKHKETPSTAGMQST